MFSDIVGYTRLMGIDEDKAFEILNINREIHTLQFSRFDGTLIKEMGDGILASFQSPLKAVECAIAIQEEVRFENIPLRIGIHVADVVFKGNDVLGDGVNVASRLQELASEGSIYISGTVYNDIRNKTNIKTRFIENKTLKNVEEPVQIYEVQLPQDENKKGVIPDEVKTKKGTIKPIYYIAGFLILVMAAILIWTKVIPISNRLHDQQVASGKKISIAVLPFDNLSGDPEQQYMCDGLTEEIIHYLSKIHSLEKVISRTSVMQFKNKDLPIPEIAKILGVNTILEGSYRQSGDRIRITAQMIDATTDDHLWSENYDRPLEDILDVQTDIAQNIANAFEFQLSEKESADLGKKPTMSVEAYSLAKKAEYIWFNYQDITAAIEILKQVLEIDPSYADAYAYIAFLNLAQGTWVGTMNMRSATELAMPYLNKALEMDPESFIACEAQAMIHYYHEWDFVEADKKYKYLNSSDRYHAELTLYTQFLMHMGRYNEALSYAKKSKDIDPLNVWNYWNLYWACNRLGQKEKSFEILEEGNDLFPGVTVLYSKTGNYYVMEGKYDLAIDYYHTFNEWWSGLGNPVNPNVLAWMGSAYYLNGEVQKADSIKNELKGLTLQSEAGSPVYFMAVYYSGIGDKEKAFEWLDRAYQIHNLELINLKDQPQFHILQDDPRYLDLYEKIGFKAYDEYIEAQIN
jgi:TolB-like protein/Tfp pilus assembly protein PilF